MNTKKANQPKAEVKPAQAAPAKAEQKPAEKQLPEAVETVPLSEVKVGAVVRYESSKKPYIVAEIATRGDSKRVLLVSMTQQYEAKLLTQRVAVVEPGKGSIPDSFTNKDHETLRKFTATFMKERATAQAAKEKARQEREAKANQAKADKEAQATKKAEASK